MAEAKAGSGNNASTADMPAVDVAQAAELTGLSKDAIRGRIRRGALGSAARNGRHRIPLAELQRQGLLVGSERYRAAVERARSLEAQLRAALESGEQAKDALRESQETGRVLWAMVRHKDQELARLWESRERGARIRWPWRRSTSPAPGNG